MALINADTDYAAALLKEGQLIGMPTETVYGLAGNAYLENSIQEIFKVKNRPNFDPLILHTSSIDRIESWIGHIPKQFIKLAEAFMPGPLTLLIPKNESISNTITANLPRVAVRIPQHELCLNLLKKLDFPVAAPSANPFGYVSPTTAVHVNAQLGDLIPFILDGGACHVGLESTILGLENNVPTIYRKGGLSIEEIEAYIGPLHIHDKSTSNPAAPGMLLRHYSPKARVKIVENFPLKPENAKSKALVFGDQKLTWPAEMTMNLSISGNLREAAQNLYATLRILDEENTEHIYIKLFEDKGLGKALNDRIKRTVDK